MPNAVKTQSMFAGYRRFVSRLGKHLFNSLWRNELILTIAATIRKPLSDDSHIANAESSMANGDSAQKPETKIPPAA